MYEKPASNYNIFKMELIAYMVLYAISVFLLKFSEIRPTVYYVVIALMATAILIDILYVEQSGKIFILTMLQIMFFTLNIIWGVTLNYYYYTGFTDILGHAGFATDLLQKGFVGDVFGVYKPFPLWHILSNYFLYFSGLQLPMNRIMNILSGLVFFVMPVAIYLLSSKLLSQKTSLLVALIASFYTPLISYGMYSIPRSIESFFFVLLLIMLFDRFSSNGEDKIKYYLAVFLMFTVLVFHTVSVIYVVLILIMIYAIQRLVSKEKTNLLVTVEYLVISVAMTVIYWGLFANTLISTLLSDIFTPASKGPLTKSVYTMPLNELFNYLQYMPALLFLIVGTILVLGYKKFNSNTRLMGLLALLLVPVTMPGPLLLINKLAGNFNLGRFEEYTFFFIALTAAIGFASLYYRSRKVFKASLVVLFTVWVLLSVSNDFVALDNPIVKRPFYTFYLTEEEVTGINNVADVTSRLVLSDYVTVRYLNSSELNPNVSILLVDQNLTSVMKRKGDVILIRDDELNKRPLQFLTCNSEGYLVNLGSYYYKGNKAYDILKNYSRMYNSSDISAYT